MEIIPSILTDDLETLRSRLLQAAAFSDVIQIDFIDGRFVPGKFTLPPDLFPHDLSSMVERPLELVAHLLTFDPLDPLEELAESGFSRALFHIEATRPSLQVESAVEASTVITKARSLGLSVGIGINPNTPAALLSPYLRIIEEILFLAVDPVRPGVFIPTVLERLKSDSDAYSGLVLSVDGGLGPDNIAAVANAGADRAYVGRSIYDIGRTAKANWKALREMTPRPS
jgi:ribulose-phosphate 3-epimerase